MKKQTGEFLDYLQTREHFEEDAMPQPGEWTGAGNTIGMLALRLDLLSVEQIDHILNVQEQRMQSCLGNDEAATDRVLFGQVAVDLGILTDRQVEQMLRIQDLHHQLELGERLVLDGSMDLETLVERLGEFLRLETVGSA